MGISWISYARKPTRYVFPTIIGIAASITVPAEAVSSLPESSIQLSIPNQMPNKDKNNPRTRYKEAILKFLKK